ncbi:DNA-binding transcriptional activator FucR [Phytobacter ursingii]|nr:DNA-binding transcriptional activator FucR [Phytobacter ursingii]
MMDALKQRIINCIKENQPVTTDTIHQQLNVSRNSIRNELQKLRDAGFVYTKISIGHFTGESAYLEWLETVGRKYLSERGAAGNKLSHASRTRHGTVRRHIANVCRKYGPLNGKQIAEKLDVPYSRIGSQICEMVSRGMLIKLGRSGSYMYTAPDDEEGSSDDAEVPEVPTFEPDIFTRCRNSETMKRILMFYGRAI